MTRFFYIILCGLLVVGCAPQSADTAQTVDVIAPSKPVVRVAAPATDMPPYFIAEARDLPHAGLEHDMIAEAFDQAGYRVEFIYLRSRLKKFNKPVYQIDCVTTVAEDSGLKGAYSVPLVAYQDIAIYRNDSGLNIRNLDDLKGKSIETFSNARIHLGLEEVVKDNPYYHEHSSKASQVLLLYRQHDPKKDESLRKPPRILLMDKNLFAYHRRKMAEMVDIYQPITINYLFPEKPYKLLCHQPEIRDAFDKGLAQLRDSKRYEALQDHYRLPIFEVTD